MTDYITIVFVGGDSVTRRKEDVYSLSRTEIPEKRQVMVNWDNVAYVRRAKEYEINSSKLFDEKEKD